MKIKNLLYFFICVTFYSAWGTSKNVSCSFRDSQNVYREFMLKRIGNNEEFFMDAERADGPYWKIMSEDNKKLILFKESTRAGSIEVSSVYTIFFIDKNSGDFRLRNYVHTEYINTVRGGCRFK